MSTPSPTLTGRAMATPEDDITIGVDQRLAHVRSGGIARYALELGDALSRLPALDVKRIRHHRDPSSSADDVRLHTPAHHRIEPLAIGVELALRRHTFDVYHATDFVAPRLMRCPVVATVHDLAFMRWPDHLRRDALNYYRKIVKQGERTAHWITPSNWTKSELVDLVGIPQSEITVVPHGVSSFVDRGEIVPRPERKPYLLAVGTIEPRKRYDLLLDAFERLAPQPRLYVAGSPGWKTENIQERLRSTDGVTWLDNASDAQIGELLSGALALAVPSLAEGFGLGMLEAMARGTPVVSSGLGALSEVAGDAALVPPRDAPDSWAEALEQILHDQELWEECSDAGYRRSRQFTWADSARKTAQVYRQVAG